MARKNGKQEREFQITKSSLILLGYVLLALGMLGRGVLQVRLLGVNTGTGEDLLHVLEMQGGMTAATTAIVFEAMELCAIPIFAVLTLDGMERTSDAKRYILRVAAVALISEIPYNVTFGGAFLYPSSRNPVFGTLLALIMLFLYRMYSEKTAAHVLTRIVVGAASILWALIFRVDFGVIFLIVVNVLWIFRERPALKEFLGAAAALCCCVANPLVMFSPFGFLVTHWYKGEKGFLVRNLQYAMYPLLLAMTGLAGYLMF